MESIYELMIKIAAVIFPAAISIWQYKKSFKYKSRSEYEYLRQYIDDLNNKPSELLIQKGFEGIYGKHELSSKEIILLLSLPNPLFVINNFSSFYLKISTYTNDIIFRKELKSPILRFIFKFFLFIIYLVLWTVISYLFFALIDVLNKENKYPNYYYILFFLFVEFVFIVNMIMVMKAFRELRSSEKLVKELTKIQENKN